MYLVLYTGISFTYQTILSRDEWLKQGFERVCLMIRSEKKDRMGDGACIDLKLPGNTRMFYLLTSS